MGDSYLDKGFSRIHPLVGSIYYCFIFSFALFFSHFYYLTLLIFFVFWFDFFQENRMSMKMWSFYIWMAMFVFAINLLMNDAGDTVLFRFFERDVTLESITYGARMSLSLLTMLTSFVCYQKVVNPHKFMYLSSFILPKLSLLMMMVMGFVSLLKERIHQISLVQRTMGVDVKTGPLTKRIKDGMKILQILIGWSLEEAVCTANSMKARGYGVSKRSSYFEYRFRQNDYFLLLEIVFLGGLIWFGFSRGYGIITIYPQLSGLKLEPTGWIYLVVFSLFLFIPLFEEGKEFLKWRF